MSNGGTPPRHAAVALPIPVRRLFTYAVPPADADGLRVGSRVRVPLGKRTATGTVVGWPADPPDAAIDVRSIRTVLRDAPSPNQQILALTRFVSDYYLCSWGEAIEAALPPDPGPEPVRRQIRRLPGTDPGILPKNATARRRLLAALPADGAPIALGSIASRDRPVIRHLVRLGLVALDESTVNRPAAVRAERPPAPPDLTLTPEQSCALGSLIGALEAGRYAPFLLHGITGSGKTEVYLRAARTALEGGRGVLYLVPEIGLTPLLMSRLRSRFGTDVEVLHSGLSNRERYRAWRRVDRGECRFVVGTRSAVFAPVTALALVIVDEEHDASYKQGETPRYNGRDMAVWRARDTGAVVVLGSATPSMESYQHCRAGRYVRLRLGERVERRALPEVDVVDMRREFRERNEIRPLSGPLLGALRQALENGEQALVLRNRRGWAAAMFCPRCGNRVQCPQCSIAMTWHRRDRRLRCHTCDSSSAAPGSCPHCAGDELKLLGEGSERIEDELRRELPGVRIARMDRDTVRGRGAHERLLRRFERREIDVLVGTQMIAKGHDFPGVTVVGVLSADQSLGLPDFRAGERTFQLLTQVAGRSGRGDRPGRVVLQAFDPGHAVLREAVVQDFDAFFEREIEYRRALRYPPFTALVQIRISDPVRGRAAEWATRVAEAVRHEGRNRLIVAGPGPAPVERIKNRYRYQILVRSAGRRKMIDAIGTALDHVDRVVPRRAIVVDVDSYSLL